MTTDEALAIAHETLGRGGETPVCLVELAEHADIDAGTATDPCRRAISLETLANLLHYAAGLLTRGVPSA